MSMQNHPNEMLAGFATIGNRIGNTILRINDKDEIPEEEARKKADRMVSQFVNRVHRPLPNRREFGPRATIGCMHLLVDELTYRHEKNGPPPMQDEELLDFTDRVTMHAVRTDQNWGTAFDQLVHGE